MPDMDEFQRLVDNINRILAGTPVRDLQESIGAVAAAFSRKEFEADRLRAELAAANARVEAMAGVLKSHHDWHQSIGAVLFPQEPGQEAPTEINLSVEYADSTLCQRTMAALREIRDPTPPAAPDTLPWPYGCHDEASCGGRHRSCMYLKCPHGGRDIRAEIDEEIKRRAAAKAAIGDMS